jgi:hypothetical protein
MQESHRKSIKMEMDWKGVTSGTVIQEVEKKTAQEINT